jgi:hypothetical protein
MRRQAERLAECYFNNNPNKIATPECEIVEEQKSFPTQLTLFDYLKI